MLGTAGCLLSCRHCTTYDDVLYNGSLCGVFVPVALLTWLGLAAWIAGMVLWHLPQDDLGEAAAGFSFRGTSAAGLALTLAAIAMFATNAVVLALGGFRCRGETVGLI